jgi:hypothetical protein
MISYTLIKPQSIAKWFNHNDIIIEM